MPHDPAEATRIAAANRRVRAEWLVALRAGQRTLDETIRAAVLSENAPLLKLRLDDVVCAWWPDISVQRRDLFVAKVRRFTDFPASKPDRSMTLGWLLRNNQRNPGALAHRIAALYDALDTTSAVRSKRVEGFPFSYPNDLAAVWSMPETASR